MAEIVKEKTRIDTKHNRILIGRAYVRRNNVLIERDPYGFDIYLHLNAMPTPHVVIFGPVGMGKTWTAATLLLRLRRAGYDSYVTIFDPYGDYVNLRDALGTKVVKIGENYIDIFSNNDDEMNKLAMELTGDKLNEVMNLNQIKNYYASLFVGDALPITVAKDVIVTFSVRALGDPDFVYIYNTLLARQLYRHALEVAKGDKWIIVVDDSYFFNEEILKKLIIERKSGVGIWFVTHEPSLLSREVMASTHLKIILGGGDVPKVLNDILKLDGYEAKWLRDARSPRELGGRAQALIIRGSADVRYLGHVELEQEVRPGGP